MTAVRTFLVVVAALSSCAARAAALDGRLQSPRLFLLDSLALTGAQRRIPSGDASLASALAKLEREADRALAVGNLSVTEKTLLPPSKDKRDYMSFAPYWWPNPHTPDGLPYVRRDGEVNPARDLASDRKRLEDLVQNVKTLALAYFYTGKDPYAAHAAKRLRTWFLDDKTRMNPHLKYAQAVPGRNVGRAAGIIEAHNLPELLDAVGLLQPSRAWTPADQKRLQHWFDAYLDWLIESPEGKSEAKAENNHGTWYDVQVAAYALFVGREEVASRILREFPSRRMTGQIAPDGRQPRELERTRAWHYSIFNLQAMMDAASLADGVGVDLWSFETTDKRGIRRALDWLVPFATGKAHWAYREIPRFEPAKLAPLLRRAAIRYREPAYDKIVGELKITGDERWQLLYPKIQPGA